MALRGRARGRSPPALRELQLQRLLRRSQREWEHESSAAGKRAAAVPASESAGDDGEATGCGVAVAELSRGDVRARERAGEDAVSSDAAPVAHTVAAGEQAVAELAQDGVDMDAEQGGNDDADSNRTIVCSHRVDQAPVSGRRAVLEPREEASGAAGPSVLRRAAGLLPSNDGRDRDRRHQLHDWQVIPPEDIVAAFQGRRTLFFATASTDADAQVYLECPWVAMV